MIPFNKPFFVGKEVHYVYEALSNGHVSGNGSFTKRVQSLLEKSFGYEKVLLTSSCTDALEMSALLCDIVPGDEIIVPSYTFVSSALAFVREGAKIIYVDSMDRYPNLDLDKVEGLISSKTKAIVAVHYGGMSVDMDRLRKLCDDYNIFLIEDAAQSIGVRYNNSFLGSYGDLATFSFHETKNISCGEGGALVINNHSMFKRADIIWEKGTNRTAFFQGEVDKYGWVDKGSSFLPSDITAAFLLAQLESIDDINGKRVMLWKRYFNGLSELGLETSTVQPNNGNNGHLFYIVARSKDERQDLIEYLKGKGIHSVFHYQSLHSSSFELRNSKQILPLYNADKYSEKLVRLPIFYDLSLEQVDEIIKAIKSFYA